MYANSLLQRKKLKNQNKQNSCRVVVVTIVTAINALPQGTGHKSRNMCKLSERGGRTMAKNRTMAIKHAKARKMAGVEARNKEYDRCEATYFYQAPKQLGIDFLTRQHRYSQLCKSVASTH